MEEIEQKKALRKQKIKERDEREKVEMFVEAEKRFLKEKVNIGYNLKNFLLDTCAQQQLR